MSDTGSHVILRPAPRHECSPGWTSKTGTDGKRYGIPPSSHDYPRGTVWACSCGKTWISEGAPRNSPILLRWKPEGRLARWRRTRKAG